MQSSNLDFLSKLISFVKHPTYEIEVIENPLFIFKRILTLISWLFVLVFPIAIAITLLLKLLKYDGVNAVNELTLTGEIWTVLFLGVVVAPLIEEITFRLPLRYHRLFILVSTFMVIRITAVYILRQMYPAIPNLSVVSLAIPLITCFVLYFILGIGKVERTIKNFYAQHFTLLFYTLTILFGLLHITNYSNVQGILLIVLLLGIPQIIVGIGLGFIRIRYGFIYGLLMHSLYNGILLIPSSIVKGDSDSPHYMVAGVFAFLVLSLLIYGIVSLSSAGYHYLRQEVKN